RADLLGGAHLWVVAPSAKKSASTAHCVPSRQPARPAKRLRLRHSANLPVLLPARPLTLEFREFHPSCNLHEIKKSRPGQGRGFSPRYHPDWLCLHSPLDQQPSTTRRLACPLTGARRLRLLTCAVLG